MTLKRIYSIKGKPNGLFLYRGLYRGLTFVHNNSDNGSIMISNIMISNFKLAVSIAIDDFVHCDGCHLGDQDEEGKRHGLVYN